VPFDADGERLEGEPVQLFDGISAAGQPQFAVAGDGTLAYVPAPSTRRRLVWVDRSGRQSRVVDKEDRFSHPRISPQGDRVLVQILDTTGPYDFWIHQLERRSDVRLSVRGSRPVWEPDGLRITYAASGGLYSVPADDSRTPDLLVPLERPANALFPLAWSRDGVFVFSRPAPETNRDVFTMRRGETPRAVLVSPRDERAAMLSPDGRWIVYAVREVGREEEVYVQAYPSGAGRTIVSAGGGLEPMWSGTGKEIFYRSTDGSRLLSVDVTTSPGFHAGTPRTLFTGRFALGSSFWADYDVTRDGNRFLMLEGADESSTGLNVVMNWLTPQGVASGTFAP
jgi:serine/threonine-protein kinase